MTLRGPDGNNAQQQWSPPPSSSSPTRRYHCARRMAHPPFLGAFLVIIWFGGHGWCFGTRWISRSSLHLMVGRGQRSVAADSTTSHGTARQEGIHIELGGQITSQGRYLLLATAHLLYALTGKRRIGRARIIIACALLKSRYPFGYGQRAIGGHGWQGENKSNQLQGRLTYCDLIASSQHCIAIIVRA